MIALLHFLQRKLRPELNDQPAPTRYLMMNDVVGILYSLPLVILGLFWLILSSDWAVFTSNSLWMGLIIIAIIIFSRLRFYIMHALRNGQMIATDGDFVTVILWTGLLIFGPSIIWIFVIWTLVELCLALRRSFNRDLRWNTARTASLNLASLLIPSLFALIIYQNLGGKIPIPGLSPQNLYPAIIAVIGFALIFFLVWLPLLLYVIWVQDSKFGIENTASIFWFSALTMELPFISLVIGVLASGIYVEHGGIVLGFYFLGLLLIALLANQLSQSAEKSRRQTVQLMGLEGLGRDLLSAPVDARNLPALLRKHIPNMFPCHRAAIWLAPETYLLRFPDGKEGHTPQIWDWLLAQGEPQIFLETDPLPWEKTTERHFALLTTPVLDQLTGKPLGGLFIELRSTPQGWDRTTLQQHTPALQNLASQIATTLQQADSFQETLKHQRVTQELRLAGNIQASFLPDHPPEIPGWDIAANLIPARQTSGDFYDFFMMADERLGFLIADVADKGFGAALYMALGRTLLLTYAQEYPENPAGVLQATNQRILQDTRAQMFITVFYGVLEPDSGRLTYCNAGHHPPLLIRKNQASDILRLNPNGIALGIDPNAAWVASSQHIDVDDTLLLYTDGVVEAINPTGGFYGMRNLTKLAKKVANQPSQWIIRAIEEDVRRFQEGIEQSDDITLVCLRRRAFKE